jgi:hypothetical protein
VTFFVRASQQLNVKIRAYAAFAAVKDREFFAEHAYL